MLARSCRNTVADPSGRLLLREKIAELWRETGGRQGRLSEEDKGEKDSGRHLFSISSR